MEYTSGWISQLIIISFIYTFYITLHIRKEYYETQTIKSTAAENAKHDPRDHSSFEYF